MFKTNPAFLYLLILLALLSGCYPEGVQVSPGLMTHEITGRMTDQNGKALVQDSFIVVKSYYSTFIQFEDQPPLYAPKARLVFPNRSGEFQVPVDFNAVKLELTFIAPDVAMQTFDFQRQVGVGNLRYDPQLVRTQRWHDHFFVAIMPYLQEFILEKRYEMADAHQLVIGDWLAKQKERLAHQPRSNPSAG